MSNNGGKHSNDRDGSRKGTPVPPKPKENPSGGGKREKGK